MFVGTFAWAFVYVSLPFHVQAISTLDAAATLRWAGFIGPVRATTVLARTSPELLYVLLGVVGLACVPWVRVRKLRAAQ